ncbi:DUF4397 domain-containing protein [Natronoglomus mannanivorans]|uniref:DUF4397 domain-containing protein n=1 Tax=Natronoglomus mannanivorans TaxID=2979990 RepID=A0AAP2YWL2_9EURY|nr:DUF4397 domain-containing protein [Halobacteria archaeon AArc-xg1-1]
MTLSRRSTLKTIGALGAGTAMTGTALAVGEHEDDDREADDERADGDLEAAAAVRVAHFSTDAPDVDVYLDDEQVLSGVAFDEVSSYLEVEPGPHSVRITAADDSETVVFEDEVSFSRAFYTIAAIGELEAETFRPLILTDAGSALVRLGHAAADAPAVSVTGNDGQMSLYENVSFGDVTNYVALPAGQYTLEVTEARDEASDSEAGGTAPEHDEVEDAEENDDEHDTDDTEGDDYESEEYDDDDADHDEDEDADVDDDYEDDDNGDADDYDNGEDDDEDVDDEQALDEDSDDAEHTDDTDPITTFEVDLEQGGAYTAYAVGAQEGTDDGDGDELSVTVTEDGPMAEGMDDGMDDREDESHEETDDADEDDDSESDSE